jgi:VanZ family protein
VIPPRRSALTAVTHLGPAVLYVAAIFVGGSLSGGETYVTMTDKQLHAAAFGAMVPLLVRAMRFVRPIPNLWMQIGVAAGSSSLVGALLEIWQAILPHRDADVLDWVADTIGATVSGSMLAAFAIFFGVVGFTGEN